MDFSFDGGVTWQDVKFFRGAEPKYFNRGNEEATISFSVRRVHVNQSECIMFCLEHMTSTPKKGLITFSADRANPKKFELYAKGKVATVGSAFKGKESRMRYTLKVGQISRTKPK